MIASIWPYLGDLHTVFADRPHWGGLVLVLVSVLCGTAVGLERESKDKPAGLRTVSLICLGSTIFTLAGVMLGDPLFTDKSRVAAQVVTGIGFLGAGAIIRERGRVVGLTTGATIWTVAAIGVMIGAGYAAAGIVFTLLVISLLTLMRRFERGLVHPCRYARIRVIYRPAKGKTRLRLLHILDHYRIPSEAWEIGRQDDLEYFDIRYCYSHRQHRTFVYRLVKVEGVAEVQSEPAAEMTGGDPQHDG
jgi:putative Mg2+ transporter-C (MgtC) family protein